MTSDPDCVSGWGTATHQKVNETAHQIISTQLVDANSIMFQLFGFAALLGSRNLSDDTQAQTRYRSSATGIPQTENDRTPRAEANSMRDVRLMTPRRDSISSNENDLPGTPYTGGMSLLFNADMRHTNPINLSILKLSGPDEFLRVESESGQERSWFRD
ncbi:uncharacterized protein BDZ99DRAFT_525815 [Mytilinidion resinicola]|uniref:Uncharacterized protein n=1 Tax=Mytilinidion resinicola TaxID=574789 RepID=A0A6A6Y6S3_9PEZI|nr:uncharacterized protein BDZ99DRAFT_525815 [Mytilinidion resinicola]KAF2804223.1 hypothetical protein BDZ99DRAFT_525815 [Mytilinidion resinicola]